MLKQGNLLIGVNVVLRGSSESGTISDLNGNYSLSVPESSSLIFFLYRLCYPRSISRR